jgi:hypothetical protein
VSIELKETDGHCTYDRPYNLLPAFNTTFHSFQPRISLQLHTVFLSALDEAEPEEEGLTNLSAIRDRAWVDAELDSDALARAPVISLDDDPIFEYPLVNHEIRKESKAEQLRSRYDNDQARFRVYSGVKSNPGGAHRHAAKMWQAKELAANQL